MTTISVVIVGNFAYFLEFDKMTLSTIVYTALPYTNIHLVFQMVTKTIMLGTVETSSAPMAINRTTVIPSITKWEGYCQVQKDSICLKNLDLKRLFYIFQSYKPYSSVKFLRH